MKVPQLHPCPACGMPVQRGTGPNKLAWHDCEFVTSRTALPEAATVESAQAVILRRIMVEAQEAAPADLIAMLQAIREFQAPSQGVSGGAISEKLSAFLINE